MSTITQISRNSGLIGTTLCLLGSAAMATEYQFTTFAVPGATRTALWDINNFGVMVGISNDGPYDYGFIVSGGVVTKVTGMDNGKGASLVGISDGGVAVGSLYDTDGLSRPMVYANGAYSILDLGALGWNGALRGISPDGRYVTGSVVNSNGDGFSGFAYDMTLGLVVGIMPGGPIQLTTGVNNSGQVVGDTVLQDRSRMAYVYDISSRKHELFWFSGYSRVAPRGINENGLMSGWVDNGSGPMAWVGDAKGYQLLGMFQGQYLLAEGNNNAGQVVGSMRDNINSFIATPLNAVPEPSTWAMSFFGLALLAFVCCRHQELPAQGDE